MKYIFSVIMFLSIAGCSAQEIPELLKIHKITDYANLPIYNKLSEEVDGKRKWKKEYSYIDSIEVYSIQYLSDGLKIHGFLVKPKKVGEYPCVIFNRGGNNSRRSILKVGHGFVTLGQIAKEGYIVIASQYREGAGSEGVDEFGGKDVNDVLALIDVLDEIEGADTERIGMYGWSRGSIMTFRSLTQTDKIDAAIVGGTVSDCFLSIENRPEMETVYSRLIPDYASQKEKALEERSAIKWVDEFPTNVPILMLHGSEDWRTHPMQAQKLADEFKKHEIPHKLIMYEGGNHGLTEHRDQVNKESIKWFDTYLKELK